MEEKQKNKEVPSVKMNLVIEGIDDEKNVIDGQIFVIDIYRFHKLFTTAYMIDAENDTPFTQKDFWKEKPYAVYLIINLPKKDPIAVIVKDIYISHERKNEAIGIICIIETEPFDDKEIPTDLSRKDFPLFSDDEIKPITTQLEKYFILAGKDREEVQAGDQDYLLH